MKRTEKRCGKCRLTKAVAEFYRDYGRFDSLNPICKACSKVKRREEYGRGALRRTARRNVDALARGWAIPSRTLHNRVNAGWPIERAVIPNWWTGFRRHAHGQVSA